MQFHATWQLGCLYLINITDWSVSFFLPSHDRFFKTAISINDTDEKDEKDVEASPYDIGAAHIRLVRAGNVVQILFSSSLEAGFLVKESAARHRRAEDKLKGA